MLKSQQIVEIIRNGFKKLKDHRRGKNTKYRSEDILVAGYSVFHLQSPSFLAHQERLNRLKAQHNGESLFGFKCIPSDNHIRNTLDKVAVQDLQPIFSDLLDTIDKEAFKACGGLVVAIDGVYFFSSDCEVK